VSGEDNHRDYTAETAAKIRQQIEAGFLAQHDIEHSEVNAIGRDRAACAFNALRRDYVCDHAKLVSDQREHIGIVVNVKNTWTLPRRQG
jgi:hypothetical protein